MVNGSGLLGSPEITASFAPGLRNGGASIHLTALAETIACGERTSAGASEVPVSSMTFHAPLIFFQVVWNLPFSVTSTPFAFGTFIVYVPMVYPRSPDE